MSLSSEVCFRLGLCVLSEWLVGFNVLVGYSWMCASACGSARVCSQGINNLIDVCSLNLSRFLMLQTFQPF
jgi:hypothetical protein